MEDNPTKRKIKWRLNLFDVIFIICVLIAAVLIINYAGRSDGSIVSSGSSETVVYTIELQGMSGDAAFMIKPGDSLIDKIEKRPVGTIVSVEIMPSTIAQKNLLTGERIITPQPNKMDAVIVVTTDASVTESQISIGGFVVRVGLWVAINGPLYTGNGYVIDIERSDAA